MSDPQSNHKQQDKLPSGGKERPAIMHWIIIIIGVLVLAQGAVLAWFWLKM